MPRGPTPQRNNRGTVRARIKFVRSAAGRDGLINARAMSGDWIRDVPEFVELSSAHARKQIRNDDGAAY